MGFELNGFSELEKKLESLGDIGKIIANKTLRAGSDIVIGEQKKQAPRNSESDVHGADQLGASKIKKYKNGNAYIRVGLVNGEWESFKGIYFQNFNGIHSDSKNVGWMQKAFEKSKVQAEKKMKSILQAEINKIF